MVDGNEKKVSFKRTLSFCFMVVSGGGGGMVTVEHLIYSRGVHQVPDWCKTQCVNCDSRVLSDVLSLPKSS